MKLELEKYGKMIIVCLMVGVFILGTSTLFENPLALFLTIVFGAGLIMLGIVGEIIFMIADIKTFFKKIDTETTSKDI